MNDLLTLELVERIKALGNGDYTDVRALDDGTIVGIGPMAFTHAVYTDMSADSPGPRYCYKDPVEALVAYSKLRTGDDIPEGWIARKGAWRGQMLPDYVILEACDLLREDGFHGGKILERFDWLEGLDLSRWDNDSYAFKRALLATLVETYLVPKLPGNLGNYLELETYRDADGANPIRLGAEYEGLRPLLNKMSVAVPEETVRVVAEALAIGSEDRV